VFLRSAKAMKKLEASALQGRPIYLDVRRSMILQPSRFVSVGSTGLLLVCGDVRFCSVCDVVQYEDRKSFVANYKPGAD
jgi:hypothetical protein